MATKSEQLQNLVRAFGGNPRNSTIEDAIEDLIEALPVKVEKKMVEIVPLQSVTITSNDGYTSPTTIDANGKLIVGAKYTVVMDGIPYNVTCIDDDGATLGDKYENLFKEYPFNIYQGGEYDPVEILTPSEGTYTFAICGEQEDVDYIDGKFLKKVVLYGSNSSSLSSTNKKFLYHDSSYTRKVTQAELAEILDSAASVKIEYHDKDEGYNECFIAYVITEFEYWTVGFTSRGFKELELHTAEYVGAPE